MPSTDTLPARRQVAVELARLRRQAGISGKKMAELLGVTQPAISRYEAGTRLLSVPQTRAWLAAVGAKKPTRDTVLALAEASHSETVAYRWQLRQQAHLQAHVTNLESETSYLRAVDPITIHGLLQIPEYAVAIMKLADTEQMIDQDAALHARLKRQEALLDGSRSFSFVMLEQVLHAPIVTKGQLLHLADLATRSPNVTIGVVPAAAPWPAIPWSGFNLYELQDGTRVVTAELTHGEATVTGDDDVKLYADLHEQWLNQAVTADLAADLLRGLAAEQ